MILIGANDDSGQPNTDSHIVVQQRGGLYPVEVLNCLNSIVGNIKPRY